MWSSGLPISGTAPCTATPNRYRQTMAASEGPEQGGVRRRAVRTPPMHPPDLRGVGGPLTHRRDAAHSPLRHAPLRLSPGDGRTHPCHPAKRAHHAGGLRRMPDNGKRQLRLGKDHSHTTGKTRRRTSPVSQTPRKTSRCRRQLPHPTTAGARRNGTGLEHG